VEKQDARSPLFLETGLQDVHPEAINALHKARANAERKRGVCQGRQFVHRHPLDYFNDVLPYSPKEICNMKGPDQIKQLIQ
jgi:hypothetical protein